MKNLLHPLRVAILLLGLVLGLQPPAYAGSSEEAKFGVEKYGDAAIREFALKVNDQLDQRKVNLAIIARCGRPRSQLPGGIRYTHVAFVVFEPVRGDDGQVFHTYTVYNLYQCGKGQEDHSYLKQDLTYDFVAGIGEPDVAVCVPDERLQAKIIRVIRSPAYQAIYIPRYNLLANPWVDRFDNCVTHTLKVCVAGIYGTDERARIYQNIRTYFQPTLIRLGPVQSFGARFVRGLSWEDRDRSGLQTATYESLREFLATNGLVQETFTVAIE